jgi:hypothetical protein
MNLRRPALAAFLLATSHAFAQVAPATVTDAQVSQFQNSIETTCLQSGAERHDPATTVQASCTCTTQVLQTKLTKAEWQAAVAAAFNGNRQGASDIIARHQEELKVCKPAQ